MARDDDDYDSDDRDYRGGGGGGSSLIRTALLIVVMIGAILFASGAFLAGQDYRSKYRALNSYNPQVREIAEYVRELEEVNAAVSGSPPSGEATTPIAFPAAQAQYDIYIRDYKGLRGSHRVIAAGNYESEATGERRRRNFPPIQSFSRQ